MHLEIKVCILNKLRGKMAWRWGTFIAAVVLTLVAVIPRVHHAVAQEAIRPGASNNRYSQLPQPIQDALVFNPATNSVAPKDASVSLVAYDIRKAPATELVRTNLPVQGGTVRVPRACTQCMVLLQAPFPYVLAFPKGSVVFNSFASPANSTNFRFKNTTYTYAANHETNGDQQVIALRLGSPSTPTQAYSTSFRSFTEAAKGKLGVIPSAILAAPFGMIADSLIGAGANPGIQPIIGGGGNASPGAGAGSPNHNDIPIGGGPSICPCDASSPTGCRADQCCDGKKTAWICEDKQVNAKGITTCKLAGQQHCSDNGGGGGNGAPHPPGAGGGDGDGGGNQAPKCTCEHRMCGGCSDDSCQGTCPNFFCGRPDCNA